MINDDQKSDTVVADATVVNFSDERRARVAGARAAAKPRPPMKKGVSLAHDVSEGAGARGGQALRGIARSYVADRASKFVKEARKSKGYSQGELAKRIDVTQARISQWENMEKSGQTIDLVNLFTIAFACNIPLRLEWDEKLPKDAGLRRRGRTTPEKQEGRSRNNQSCHDGGEI